MPLEPRVSVFDKLVKSLGIKSRKNEFVDRRLHARFAIDMTIAKVVLANGTAGNVTDLSYSGAACEFPADAVLQAQMPARLFVLDHSVEVLITPVRIPAQPRDGKLHVGVSLLHQKPESLLFLREIIEPIRSGNTVTKIPMDVRKDQYRTEDWECLRGEGPVDFIVKLADGKVIEALLTFALDGAYSEVILKNGEIKTGRSTGSSATMTLGANMAQTVAFDHQTARRAAFILMGMPSTYQALVQPMLTTTIAAIKKSGRVAAA